MTKNDCFFFGKVTKTHGLKGEITIKLDVANPADFNDLRYLLIEEKGNLIPYFIDYQKNPLEGQCGNVQKFPVSIPMLIIFNNVFPQILQHDVHML